MDSFFPALKVAWRYVICLKLQTGHIQYPIAA